MLGTYASALLCWLAAAAVGQAVFALCGRRRWSWLAPAVGLAALMPARLVGGAAAGRGDGRAVVLGALVARVRRRYLRGGVEGSATRRGSGCRSPRSPLLAASLPFIVEGRFGILGTGLNPDMSQHLFAADRLAESAAASA